jgi:hypothetical protein
MKMPKKLLLLSLLSFLLTSCGKHDVPGGSGSGSASTAPAATWNYGLPQPGTSGSYITYSNSAFPSSVYLLNGTVIAGPIPVNVGDTIVVNTSSNLTGNINGANFSISGNYRAQVNTAGALVIKKSGSGWLSVQSIVVERCADATGANATLCTN